MPDQRSSRPVDALGVILCGGRGSRLGGTDKAALTHRGRTFLEIAAGALADCPVRVAVGDERADPGGLIWTTEVPAFGGPAAGLLAGLQAGLDAATSAAPDWVVALAVDMPLVTSGTVRRLWEGRGEDGALLVDEGGRRQYLCAIYRISSLLRNAPAEVSGMPVRRLVSGLDLVEIAATGVESQDVDAPADIGRLE